MKATVVKRVNTRLEPNTGGAKLKPLEYGSVIEAVHIENGEVVNGNVLWLTDDSGYKYAADAFTLNAAGNVLNTYIDFLRLWNFEAGRTPIKVGIYDGGIQPDKDIFGGRVIELNHDSRMPVNSHGTYMATIIGGADYKNGYYGFLPQARLFSYQAALDGNKVKMKLENFKNGIKAFLDADVDIINVSMATMEHSDDFTNDNELRNLIEICISRDIIIVASTGNEGNQKDTAINYPAGLQGVVSVGGYRVYSGNASFDINSNAWASISILAPSFPIYQNDYFTKINLAETKGTSVSAAVISGMAGICKMLAHEKGGFKSFLENQFNDMSSIEYIHQNLSQHHFHIADFKKFKTTLNI